MLPWSESLGVMTETHQIQKQLLQLNRKGYLTINSQPRINGAPSSDPHVGWGGPQGSVLLPTPHLSPSNQPNIKMRKLTKGLAEQ